MKVCSGPLQFPFHSCLLRVLVEQFDLVVENKAYTPDSSGGTFKLELFLPEDYPMAPPKVTSMIC